MLFKHMLPGLLASLPLPTPTPSLLFLPFLSKSLSLFFSDFSLSLLRLTCLRLPEVAFCPGYYACDVLLVIDCLLLFLQP
jgi:hypothetical protein